MEAKDQIKEQIAGLTSQIASITKHKAKETDSQITALYDSELELLTANLKALEQSLRALEGDYESAREVDNTGADSADAGAILEVRPGTGGDEAALFAGDLLTMYLRYAEKVGWKCETINLSEGNAGGVKIATVELKGPGAFNLLKNESGVHRVQRVPTTESAGRIHTSTATVAVLPLMTKVVIEIKPDDLKWDFFRSGGHGGQNVNKVSTAVRLTHIPTGVIVECQEERFQGKNREKALQILNSRLVSEMEAQHVKSIADIRVAQIGTGDRVEKIRTYNFPQDRVTDHRLKTSWHNIPSILSGNIQEILTQTSSL
ncbi:TPA: peptide chain release factor 1 [candidate division WWE3 bacterium]|uniref:Peptide chain release factor 1 n=3 Tax=Katanobacteria TaxID=422282 RepID=A0A0G1KK07_UNCKA|nr:MAG: Peptide chain release factor 1 [candidate division WWE3 bacterium GW2011_GWA2_44_16]KKT83835.1 MAG: Peptide chain release factor 1 [candidate division WWE3 bacterium GW2011_GWC2_44_9]HAZ29591.1 peptide chain release factor 1 [candidate division WWE3 bacterium]